MRFKDRLEDVFFPKHIKCIVCGDDIPAEKKYPVCGCCRLERNLTFCLKCGRHIHAAGQYCDSCKDRAWHFDIARAPFVYTGSAKNVIHKLKYGNGKYMAGEMSVYLADSYYEYGLMCDIISYVPMFYKKKKRRGYNQAQELAESLADALHTEAVPLLSKTVMGKSLARQTAAQRAASIKDTIELLTGVDVKEKNVLLIDDVFTTGATVNECAKVLKAAKAGKVQVLTFATSVQLQQLYRIK